MINIDDISPTYRPDVKTANCPFCEVKGKTSDTKHHLYLYESTNSYYCFRCNSTGKLTDLLSEGARSLFRPPLPEILTYFDSFDRDISPRSINLDEISRPIFEGSDAYRYLREVRNLSDIEISYYGFRIGIDKYRGRIIIPVTDSRGNFTYFVSRAYYGQTIRYKNPSIRKEDILFNYDKCKTDLVIICEGVFSAIASDKFLGFTGEYDSSVAILGSHLSWYQEMLIAGKFRKAIVALDGDRKLSEFEAIENRLRKQGLLVSSIYLPDGKDPEERGKEVWVREFNKAVGRMNGVVEDIWEQYVNN